MCILKPFGEISTFMVLTSANATECSLELVDGIHRNGVGSVYPVCLSMATQGQLSVESMHSLRS